MTITGGCGAAITQGYFYKGIGTAANAKNTEETKTFDESVLNSFFGSRNTEPYSYLAENGIIDYNGVTFVCDEDNNRLCLGDVSNPKNCLNIQLSGGGCLVVNRENLGDLANAIGMFSPEDAYRIMSAIATDNKAQEVQREIDDDKQEAFQTGAQSYTLREWDEMLEKFDEAEEAIQSEIEEETADKIEAADKEKEIEEMLLTESTICTYPNAEDSEEKTWYITCYTEQGIVCRGGKAGEMETLWSIEFTKDGQYQKVMDFLKQFPTEWNLRFAAHENFWIDFLNDEIDMDGFMEFMAETNEGVPDYSITAGDSVYVDEDKIQWAEYLNPLGAKFYTAEEIHQQLMEKVATNGMTKIRDSYEMSEIMWNNFLTEQELTEEEWNARQAEWRKKAGYPEFI